MNITRTTLLKTIPLSDGRLYATADGMRCLLASTVPVLEVYEKEIAVPIMGRGRTVKKTAYSLILCKDNEFTREVDNEYLKNITAFDLTAQAQREDGIFEVIRFNNLDLESIEPNGEWVFNTVLSDRVRALLKI